MKRPEVCSRDLGNPVFPPEVWSNCVSLRCHNGGKKRQESKQQRKEVVCGGKKEMEAKKEQKAWGRKIRGDDKRRSGAK